MNLDLMLDDKMKYVIGVSGGSDSMMLLSLCVKQGYQVIVCHVNYKLRAHADVEEQIVKEFCENNKITVYYSYPQKTTSGNFQKWARDVRYAFYQEIYQKEKCDALLLAHQLDDHIETYLMSMQRGSHGWYYGIAQDTYHHNMHIIRPLLQIRKEATKAYCIANNVEYGEDESNQSDKYARNRIRHSVVQNATDKQINDWLNEINSKNEQLEKELVYLKQEYSDKLIRIDKYRTENQETRLLILRFILSQKTDASFSSERIKQYDDVIVSSQNNGIIKVAKEFNLYHEYGYLYLDINECHYNYVLNKVDYLVNPYFRISAQGQVIQGLTLQENDYPITIRNAQPSDSIELRYGHKKVNRHFIDNKVFHYDRLRWPVIENKAGRVIFVYGIGCDVNHFSIKPSLFMIK